MTETTTLSAEHGAAGLEAATPVATHRYEHTFVTGGTARGPRTEGAGGDRPSPAHSRTPDSSGRLSGGPSRSLWRSRWPLRP
jgi:hypothetical protein